MKKNNRSFAKGYWSFSAALVVLVLFVGLVVAAYANRFGWFYSAERDSWGQFGDYVGGVVNPLLSFCAFIGLIFTLRFQTAEAVKVEQRQNDQQFDARLFQMLSLLNTSLSSVQIDRFSPAGMTSIVGHSAIKVGWRKLESELKLIDEQLLDADFHKRFTLEFRSWSDTYGDRMISYFDTLLFMLLYVRKQSDGENQRFALRAIS
ncbi:hypothetical protein [Pseudomonas syringae]|uniref:hypothetical protein n=1 Tax=Pseudomonas syringae TaxID=317 RepID=UPI003F7640BB